jgi:pimeloyl-ACP methyl ester carboxylesterase
VLLLCSRGDRLVHPDCSRALARRWQCALAEHPDAGHDLALDDADWVVARIVQQFGSARQEAPAV